MWAAIQSNRRKSAFLILALAFVLVALGYLIGAMLDPRAGGPFGVFVALGVWALMMFVSFAGGERLLLAGSGAQEVRHDQAPRLFNVVEEMQLAAGLPVRPRVFIMDSEVPNAFAVGLTPGRAAVAVTTGLMARLNRDELQGVVAHEIGHIANRDTLFMTLAGVTVGAVVLIADLFLRGLWYGGGRTRRSSRGGGEAAAVIAIAAIVLAILAPLVARLLYFACSRRREYLADASAAQFTRYPEGLASALEKIATYQTGQLQVSRAVAPMFTVNPLAAAGSAMSLFSTHPPTEDRIRVLRGMSGDASLAAYEAAFKGLHRGRTVLGAGNLAGSAEAAVRGPADAGGARPAESLRAAKDVLHRLNQYAMIACACGLRIKLPPGFNQPAVECPRCGVRLEVPAEVTAALIAAAAALDGSAAGRGA